MWLIPLSARNLEPYFFIILSSIVKSQTRIRTLKYVTSGEHCERVRVIHSNLGVPDRQSTVLSHSIGEASATETLAQVVFQVNTPTFFTRFFHYASPLEAIQSELLDEKPTRTVSSSHPQEIARLFSELVLSNSHKYFDWRWRVLATLRPAPMKTNYPRRSVYKPFQGMSSTDSWVLQNCSPIQIRDYRRALIRLFLGHHTGGIPIFSYGGDLELIGLSRDVVLMVQEAFLKTGLALLAMMVSRQIDDRSKNIVNMAITLCGITGLNVWACLKSSL